VNVVRRAHAAVTSLRKYDDCVRRKIVFRRAASLAVLCAVRERDPVGGSSLEAREAGLQKRKDPDDAANAGSMDQLREMLLGVTSTKALESLTETVTAVAREVVIPAVENVAKNAAAALEQHTIPFMADDEDAADIAAETKAREDTATSYKRLGVLASALLQRSAGLLQSGADTSDVRTSAWDSTALLSAAASELLSQAPRKDSGESDVEHGRDSADEKLECLVDDSALLVPGVAANEEALLLKTLARLRRVFANNSYDLEEDSEDIAHSATSTSTCAAQEAVNNTEWSTSLQETVYRAALTAMGVGDVEVPVPAGARNGLTELLPPLKLASYSALAFDAYETPRGGFTQLSLRDRTRLTFCSSWLVSVLFSTLARGRVSSLELDSDLAEQENVRLAARHGSLLVNELKLNGNESTADFSLYLARPDGLIASLTERDLSPKSDAPPTSSASDAIELWVYESGGDDEERDAKPHPEDTRLVAKVPLSDWSNSSASADAISFQARANNVAARSYMLERVSPKRDEQTGWPQYIGEPDLEVLQRSDNIVAQQAAAAIENARSTVRAPLDGLGLGFGRLQGDAAEVGAEDSAANDSSVADAGESLSGGTLSLKMQLFNLSKESQRADIGRYKPTKVSSAVDDAVDDASLNALKSRQWDLLSAACGTDHLSVRNAERLAFVEHIGTDTQLSIFRSVEEREIIVSFRGTDQVAWKDFVTDSLTLLHPFEPGQTGPIDLTLRLAENANDIRTRSCVHYGFLRAYASVRDELHALVSDILRACITKERSLWSGPNRDHDWTVRATGHSLGGALATLFTADAHFWFASEDVSPAEFRGTRVALVNFGSPKVGNVWFARKFNECVFDAFRIVNDSDLVARLPRNDYHHAGCTVLLNERGELWVDDHTGHDPLLSRWGSLEDLLNAELTMIDSLVSGRSIAHHLEDAYFLSVVSLVRMLSAGGERDNDDNSSKSLLAA